MNDIELIALVREAQAGNRDAFDRLVVRTEAMVFSVVLRRLRNRSEALEVTQDVFIQVLRKLRQLREPERFEAWVRKIADKGLRELNEDDEPAPILINGCIATDPQYLDGDGHRAGVGTSVYDLSYTLVGESDFTDVLAGLST